MTKEQERILAFTQRQFEVHKMYAMYWHAQATTGVAVLRNLSQGREATAEEQETGQTIGWRSLTDQEKIKDALETMKRHLHHMNDCNDVIVELMKEEQ